MAEITASLVKELRDKTNAGMMDCKEALKETGADLDAAIQYLRQKGIASASKKASRDASEGIVHAVIDAQGRSGTLAEINCETDFVAKNENFVGFVDSVVTHLSGSCADSVESAMSEAFTGGDGSLEDTVKSKIAEIGENIVLRRFGQCSLAEGTEGVVASYIHMQGKVGVLIEVGCDKAETTSNESFRELVKDLTLHIAAADPAGLTRDDVDPEVVEKEKAIFAEQMKDKPAQVIEKILVGKLDKFFSTICLLDQGFVKEPDQTISSLLEKVGSEVGDTLVIRRFIRYAVGG